MAFRKRTNAYWKKRAQEQLNYVEQQSIPHLKTIDKVYLDARKVTLEAVKQLYITYYTKQGWDVTKLNEIAPRGDIRRFKQSVQQAGFLTELPDGYKYRLSRLELIEANIWLEVRKVGITQVGIQTAAHRQAIETAYKYSLYVLSKGTGVAPAFSSLNTRAINRILNSKFYGKNYSQRIWKNNTKLAAELKQILATSVATGQSQSKTARLIRERYNVKRWEAARLVRTETNRFNTLAANESYTSVGLDEWVYIATLDSRTDDDCFIHDGKRFPLGGGPQIPLHPDCRCTQRAFIDDEYEPDERIMRDPKTGKNSYISNISFDQWQKLYK